MIEFVIGMVLGALFFGGLYLTVQGLNDAKSPSVLIGLSFMLRMLVLLAGLFFLSKKGYQGVLYALAGIIVMRYIMMFMLNRPRETPPKRGD